MIILQITKLLNTVILMREQEEMISQINHHKLQFLHTVVVGILPIGAIIKEKEKMKKSTLFKILTLFLTFVIFMNCSGCLISLILYNSEKEKQETMQFLVEKQKERKELADTLVPDIEGYTFEILPKEAFNDQEDWESKGFLDDYSFLTFYTERTQYYKHNIDYSPFRISIISPQGTTVSEISEERLMKYFEIFPNSPGYGMETIYKYGEYFLLASMTAVKYRFYYLEFPPALFLLDFENNTLYYLGYAKGWFEYGIDNKVVLDKYQMVYKLTKEGE